MTWREDWAHDIHEATKNLPNDMPLNERVRIVNAVKNRHSGAYGTSWGKKSWQAARRDYLVKFGYIPKTKRAKDFDKTLPLFPAEGEGS